MPGEYTWHTRELSWARKGSAFATAGHTDPSRDYTHVFVGSAMCEVTCEKTASCRSFVEVCLFSLSFHFEVTCESFK